MRLVILLFFALLIVCGQWAYAQRFEAEQATLSGGATKNSSQARSGGQYVSQNEGSLAWNVSLATEGYFNIFINAAAPSGSKINVFSIDDNTIDFSASSTAYSSQQVAASLKLAAGSHSVRITKSWGYIDLDYIELKQVQISDRFSINKTLVTPSPHPSAARLYQFLYDNYGRKIISGVMTLESFDEVSWLKTNTGKEPALIGLDFMHSGRNYDWYNDRQPIEDAKAYYERNGIPALCWHWRDPSRKTEEFYSSKTTFDVSKILDPASAEYAAMITDIDFVSGLLKELQDANVPVIWRPLHEAAGGWFWWGAKGAAPCKKLFQVMYDRMVNHHGLKNLIWVWTREPNDADWYPGDQYVDIVGRDIYKDGNHTSHALEWGVMNELYNSKKMIALSECGSFPDPDKISADGASWSWFMPWYGAFVKDEKYNSLSLWKKAMVHEHVITLDEMPDLKTYEPVIHEPDSGPVLSLAETEKNDVAIFPTSIQDNVFIQSELPIGRIVIMDSWGRTIYSASADEKHVAISFAENSKGLYFIKIRNRPAVKLMKR